MANICSNDIFIYSIHRQDIDLLKLYLKLYELYQNEQYLTLADINRILCDDKVQIFTDLCIDGLWFVDGERYGIRMQGHSKWVPAEMTLQKIIKKIIPDNKFKTVCVAEEPGCELFVNTDVDHVYFDDKAKIEYSWQDTDGEEHEETEYYYYDEFDKFKDMIKLLSGVEISDWEDIHTTKVMNKINEGFKKSYDSAVGYININLFENIA